MRTIKRKEYRHGGKKVILDAAELFPGQFETILMRPNGDEIECGSAANEADALYLFGLYLSKHPEDTEPIPLSGRYAQLRDDLQAVAQIGLAAAEASDDGGACNFDSPVIALPRWSRKLIEQAAKEAGCGCFAVRPGLWDFSPRCIQGQANKRTAAAEAMAEALKDKGYDAAVWYQLD